MQAMRTEMAFYKRLLDGANHPFQDVTHWGWVHPSGGEQEVEPMNKYGKEQRAVNRIIYEACTGRTWTTYSKKIDRMKNALLTAYFTGDFPQRQVQVSVLGAISNLFAPVGRAVIIHKNISTTMRGMRNETCRKFRARN